ncbi:hypothetical protein M8J77_015418 [Diaphorina citri]|nr:hypothetical protein M8J77_015418 [Diaphorina citri]
MYNFPLFFLLLQLKLQDALEKKQRFDREHEEILRDIRTGLLHLNRSGPGPGAANSDDTYMYDDEMIRHYGPHWYDEPPYESDPEDFLMVGQEQPNGRVCYTLSNRPESALHHRPRGLGPPGLNTEGSVISLRSAGDISLPQHSRHQRGLLLPHTGLIIPLRGHNRESGDYAASDVQSICSRLSSVSMETSRSDQIDTELYHRLRCCNGGDTMASPGHSSDYADEDLITLNSSYSGSTPLAPRTRVRGGGGKGEEKYRRHPGRYYHPRKQHAGRAPRSNSSAESLPSTCSSQVLLEDRKPAATLGGGSSSVVMTRAVALVDNTNSPYDKEALKFKKGDIINVISMCTSGLWRGYLAHDEHKRIGTFKFINVQLVPLETSGGSVVNHYTRKYNGRHHGNQMSGHQASRQTTHKHRPKTLEQLLRTIDMEEHMSVFVLNGYEDLESFCEIKEEDLNYLKILNPEHRAKILAAVQVMHEYESPDEDEESSLDEDDSSFSGKHARNNLDSEHSTDDTRSTNTTSTTIVSNNSSLVNHKGDLISTEVSDTVVTCGDKVSIRILGVPIQHPLPLYLITLAWSIIREISYPLRCRILWSLVEISLVNHKGDLISTEVSDTVVTCGDKVSIRILGVPIQHPLPLYLITLAWSIIREISYPLRCRILWSLVEISLVNHKGDLISTEVSDTVVTCGDKVSIRILGVPIQHPLPLYPITLAWSIIREISYPLRCRILWSLVEISLVNHKGDLISTEVSDTVVTCGDKVSIRILGVPIQHPLPLYLITLAWSIIREISYPLRCRILWSLVEISLVNHKGDLISTEVSDTVVTCGDKVSIRILGVPIQHPLPLYLITLAWSIIREISYPLRCRILWSLVEISLVNHKGDLISTEVSDTVVTCGDKVSIRILGVPIQHPLPLYLITLAWSIIREISYPLRCRILWSLVEISLVNHKGDLISTEVSDTVVTCGDKIQVIKYVPGEVECESGTPVGPPRTNTSYCGFSEKSSDSGVSSSSVSSGKQTLQGRRCNGNSLGNTPSSQPTLTAPGGSKVALIERSNKSYVGHFIRKTPNTSHPLQLND